MPHPLRPLPRELILASLLALAACRQIVGVEDWDLDDATPKVSQRWVRVVLKNGIGYMASEHIRSAIEARACFTRSRGKTPNAGPWRMISLTVGGG